MFQYTKHKNSLHMLNVTRATKIGGAIDRPIVSKKKYQHVENALLDSQTKRESTNYCIKTSVVILVKGVKTERNFTINTPKKLRSGTKNVNE